MRYMSQVGIFEICEPIGDPSRPRSTHKPPPPDLGVLTSLAFGVLSAFTGPLVAFPMETVSRRLQVSRGLTISGVIGELTKGGIASFYR